MDYAPDFCIRCLPEDVSFPVQKAKLMEGSQVFYMFSCCDSEEDTEKPDHVDIYESVKDVEILVRLLHDPPPILPESKPLKRSAMKPDLHSESATAQAAIPHPLLPRLFTLTDKYVFKPPITKVLHSHLLAQAPTAPLLVYGLAAQHSLPEIANKASTFLSSIPLSSFTSEEIKIIPTAEALHKLLLLQNHRQLKFKELVMNEELFPHGYGVCDAHKVHVESLWETTCQAILPDVHSGTDVAAKMARGLKGNDRRCKTCRKAWVAATDMLSYKCQRVARRISKLPAEGQ